MLSLALAKGDVILIVVLVTIPIALITFATGAGKALGQIGKGRLSVEFESDLMQKAPAAQPSGEGSAEREDEIRQLLEAKAYRQKARGEAPVDVEQEMGKLLDTGPATDLDSDAELREEVRQLVVARNERRARQGKPPLDVEEEIERQLRELEGLGQ